MDYLQRALKSGLDFDTRKFVLLRLAGIYEAKRMFNEAARLIKSSADINTTYAGKINDYMKSVELFIKSGNFDEADIVFKQALACGNNKEKEEIKTNLKSYYVSQAEIYLGLDKRNHAKKTYERILKLELNPNEKLEIQKKLLDLYQRLGLIREYSVLKGSM